MDNLKIRIDSLSFGGSGVGRHEGIVYFVPYGAPGDLLEVRVTKTEKRYREAEIVRIIEPSPHRVEPPCPYFGECGGCQWQHVDYETQITAKITELLKSLTKSRMEHEASLVKPIIPSPAEFGYRRMARFKISRDSGKLPAPGFYRGGSRELVEIDRCLLLDDRINEYIRHADLGKPGLIGVDLFLDADGEVKPFYRSSDADPGADFIQVNSGINDKMRDFVGESLRRELAMLNIGKDKTRILDLYCGDGNLSLQFSDAASEISGWDSSRTAIERGRLAAERINGGASSCRIRFNEAEVGRAWKQIAAFGRRTDCVIVDPPRRGLKKTTERLAGLKIPLIVYVSCSPPDLVRDLGVLKGHGYEIAEIQPFDMFPQTYHLETVVVLRKKDRSPEKD